MYKKNSCSNNANGHPNKRLCVAQNSHQPASSTFTHNSSTFDDDDVWDDLDPSVIEDCMLKATQALTQRPITPASPKFEVPSLITKRPITPASPKFEVPSLITKKPASKVNVIDSKNSISSFSTKSGKDFLKNKFSDFNGGTTKRACTTNNNGPVLDQASLKLTEDLTTLKKDKKDLEEELFIKQGEVSNLRNELRRKDNVIEAERVERCAAVETAEKRGKEKIGKNVVELETTVTSLKKQLEKSQGDIIFKNREVEELVSRCRKLEQQSSPATKPLTTSRQGGPPFPSSSKKSMISPGKGPSNLSPGKSSTNFNQRFDFSGAKTKARIHLIDAQSQTEHAKEKLHRHRIHATKRGKIPYNRRISLAFSSSLKTACESPSASLEGLYLPSLYSSLLCLRAPEYSLLERTTSLSSESVDNIVSEACRKLKEIRESLCSGKQSTIHNNGMPLWLREGLQLKQWYRLNCLPHVKVICIYPCSGDVWHKAVEEVASHLKPISHEGENVNAEMVEACLECLSSLGNRSNHLPKSLCDSVLSSLRTSFLNFSPDEATILGLCCALTSFSSLENFRLQLCFEASEDCFLRCFCTFIDTNMSLVSNPLKVCQQLVKWISALVTKPPFWLSKSRCSCPTQLLSTLITYLDEIMKPSASEETLHVIISGVSVLHRWQLIDHSWWEKVAPLPHYVSLMSAFSRSCVAMKNRGILDQASRELVLDLYDADEMASS